MSHWLFPCLDYTYSMSHWLFFPCLDYTYSMSHWSFPLFRLHIQHVTPVVFLCLDYTYSMLHCLIFPCLDCTYTKLHWLILPRFYCRNMMLHWLIFLLYCLPKHHVTLVDFCPVFNCRNTNFSPACLDH